MLKIDYGCPDNIYFNVDIIFDVVFEMEWLDDPMVKRILNEIDNCTWNGVALVDNTEGYTFGIHDISSGSKGLIICECMPDDVIEIWGTMFGDNCTNILLDIAEKRDIIIYLEHFLEFDKKRFKAFSIKKQKMYESYRDYFYELALEATKW